MRKECFVSFHDLEAREAKVPLEMNPGPDLHASDLIEKPTQKFLPTRGGITADRALGQRWAVFTSSRVLLHCPGLHLLP